MARNKTNKRNSASVNAANAASVNSANEQNTAVKAESVLLFGSVRSAELASVLSHKSEISGLGEKFYDGLTSKAVSAKVREHSMFNGRLVDACKTMSNSLARELAKTIECKIATKSHLPHFCFAFRNEAGELEKFILLAKPVMCKSDAKPALDKATADKLSRKDVTLIGYSFDGVEFVATTDYADLVFEHKYTERVVVEVQDENGKTILDEEGKPVKRVVRELHTNSKGEEKWRDKTEVKTSFFRLEFNEEVRVSDFTKALKAGMQDVMSQIVFPEAKA